MVSTEFITKNNERNNVILVRDSNYIWFLNMPIMSRRAWRFNSQSIGKSSLSRLLYTYVNILVGNIIIGFSEKIKLDWSFN